RDARGDPADPGDVRVSVLLRVAEPLRQMRADDVAVEMVDDEAALLELGLDDVRHRCLPGRAQSCEPDDEPAHAGTSPDGIVWMPHSVLSVPAQRPSRPLPGTVEWMSPIES